MKPMLPFALAAVAVLGSSFAIAADELPAPSLLAAAPADSSATPSSPEATPPAATPPAPPAPPAQHSWGQRPGRDGQPGAGGNQFFREHRQHFQRPGGERPDGGDGRSQGDGQGRAPRPQAPAAKPAPYIGVGTSSVPPILASQLGLAENFGLVVDNVLPNSPAATAGLQKYDVLKLYNDQQIVDPRQLVILVHATGKDGSATLTVIRKGQEQKISIKIGEGVLPNLLAAHHPGQGMRGDGAEHHGFDRQRLSHEGADSQGFGEGWGRHEGFGRHHFDHNGFGQGRFGEEGFGRHEFWHHHSAGRGFGEDGFGRHEHRHYQFGGREFGGHGFDGGGFGHRESGQHEFGQHGFGRHDSAGRGFGRDGDGDRQFGRRSPEHGGPQQQPPGDGRRDHESQGRDGGWSHHPSSDLEPSPESPAADQAEPPLRDTPSADTASVETGSDQSLPAETQVGEEEPAPAPVFEGEPLDPVIADTNVL